MPEARFLGERVFPSLLEKQSKTRFHYTVREHRKTKLTQETNTGKLNIKLRIVFIQTGSPYTALKDPPTLEGKHVPAWPAQENRFFRTTSTFTHCSLHDVKRKLTNRKDPRQ